MPTNDNEWYNEWQQVATSEIEYQRITLRDNEWQRVTTSVTTNENERKRIRASKREWFWFQNETIHAMCNYNVFSNTNYL